MNYVALLIASLALAISGYFGVQSLHQAPKAGTTLTTLNGSDNIKNFPTTYNANNAAINAGKIEVGSTSIAAINTLSGLTSAASLATIGTITSGIWQGTVIDVARQGTGTTSPTLNQIMFGNAASGFKVIGFGTSGQSLQSAGAGLVPVWSSASVDQSLAYLWTGNHNFTANTYVKNFNASSTSANPIVLNTVSYDTPSTQGASSTVLVNDGSGHLKWQVSSSAIISTTTSFASPTASGASASKSIYCLYPKTAVSGGWSGIPVSSGNSSVVMTASQQNNSDITRWDFTASCNTGATCGAGTITVYALCVNP